MLQQATRLPPLLFYFTKSRRLQASEQGLPADLYIFEQRLQVLFKVDIVNGAIAAAGDGVFLASAVGVVGATGFVGAWARLKVARHHREQLRGISVLYVQTERRRSKTDLPRERVAEPGRGRRRRLRRLHPRTFGAEPIRGRLWWGSLRRRCLLLIIIVVRE